MEKPKPPPPWQLPKPPPPIPKPPPPSRSSAATTVPAHFIRERTKTVAELRRIADALEQLDDADAFEVLCWLSPCWEPLKRDVGRVMVW